MTGALLKRLSLFLLLAAAVGTSGCAMSEAAKKKAAYHYQMGQSYYAENNVTGALVELTEAEKMTPKDPELLNLLGLTYYRKGRFETAEEKYRKALALKPGYAEARNNLGVVLLEEKRWQDAAREFTQVLDDIFYRDHEGASINLGLAYLGAGDYSLALSTLRNVVSRNPREFRARLHLGRTYFALDKTDLAIAEYKKALELNRSYANAHYHLALAQVKTKDSAGARSSFKEVVRIAPDSEIGQLSREYLDVLK